MFKRLVIIFCIIFLYSNLLSLSQQLPTETDQLTIITRENFTDLERITALGEGQLYAIDWHPNNEILDDIDFMVLSDEEKEKHRVGWNMPKINKKYILKNKLVSRAD